MSDKLKKRIYTGLCLLLILALMFVSKIIYLYIVIIIFAFSFIEFSKISKIIFKKKRVYFILSNYLFLIYLSIFFLILILAINNIHLKLMLFLIILVCVASDIGGITFGKLFQGPKLTKISPKKTVSGAIGSLVLSTLILIISIYYFTENLSYKTIVVGLITSTACQIGDLLFSLLKRKAKIKDTEIGRAHV